MTFEQVYREFEKLTGELVVGGNNGKKERIKELKKWVKSRPNGEAIVELELDYLEGRKERGSAEMILLIIF